MIIYDKLWQLMKNKGITKYALREKHGFEQRTIKRLMNNDNIEMATLDKLCTILDCDINDIATHTKDMYDA